MTWIPSKRNNDSPGNDVWNGVYGAKMTLGHILLHKFCFKRFFFFAVKNVAGTGRLSKDCFLHVA